MIAFIVSRLLQATLVLLTVAFLSFFVFTFLGDPTQSMVSEDTGKEARELLREQLGLNDSTAVQFVRFIGRAVHGDFGISYRNSTPVAKLIAERFPATLELVACASVLALAIGVPLGVFTGLHRSTKLAKFIQATSLVGISLPSFVIGILLILLFAVTLNWLPSFGRGQIVNLGWWTTGFLTATGLKSLILPSITLGVFQLTLIMRLVRAEFLEVMRTDYIKFAKARGVPKRVIHYNYALKGALVPVITVIGLQVGSLIAFAIVTETVFQWPGMGALFMQAVAFGDIPVMAAYLMLIALVFVTINLLVDLSYFLIDPRLSARK